MSAVFRIIHVTIAAIVLGACSGGGGEIGRAPQTGPEPGPTPPPSTPPPSTTPLSPPPGEVALVGVPDSHPRLWYSTVPGSPGAARLARAKAYLAASPDDPDTGHWRPSTKNRNLALQSLLTGVASDGCNEAIAWARTFNFPSIDEARYSGENAILIYDWCYPHMSDADRQTIRNNWNTSLTKFNEQYNEWNGPTWGGLHMASNNYFWGYLRNSLLWGIAIYHEDPQKAQEFIDHALSARLAGKFKPWYETFGKGGATLEGSQYGPYILGYPVIAFTSASDYGYDAWSVTPYFRDAVYYLEYVAPRAPTQAADGAAPFFEVFPHSDDQFFVNGRTAVHEEYADLLGSTILRDPSKPIAAQAEAWLARIGAQPGWHVRAELATATVTGHAPSLPLDYYAAGAQYLYGRRNADPDSTAIMLQLGSFDASTNVEGPMAASGGVGHNHLDVGNFQIWRRGRWMSRETTGYSNPQPDTDNGKILGLDGALRTELREAIAHNTVLFEGRAQIDWLSGLAKVTRLQSHPEFVFASADLSHAYRAVVEHDWDAKRDWPYAESVTREFIYLRKLDALLILDRLRSGDDSLDPKYASLSLPKRTAADVRKTFVLHAGVSGGASPFAFAGGNKVTATVGGQRMDLVTLLPASPTPLSYRVTDERGPVGQYPIGQYRLEVDTFGSAESYFLNVIGLRDQGEPAIEASMTRTTTTWTVTLRRGTQTAVVRLVQGMASRDGSVTIGGVTTPLRNDVQVMNINESAPWWPTATRTTTHTAQAAPSRASARKAVRKKPAKSCTVLCF